MYSQKQNNVKWNYSKTGFQFKVMTGPKKPINIIIKCFIIEDNSNITDEVK